MADSRLKYKYNPAGLYAYISTPERDILLTTEVIQDPKSQQVIEEYINSIETKIYAYERYKAALNSIKALCRRTPNSQAIEEIATGALNQFHDLAMPGDPNKN